MKSMSCSYSPTCCLNRYTEIERSLNFYFKQCIQNYLPYSCCVSHIVSYTVKSLSLSCIEVYCTVHHRIKYVTETIWMSPSELQCNGGREHFLFKSGNRKSANCSAHWKSANCLGFASPQIHNFFMKIDPRILDSQISLVVPVS
jgi:hypothetical protein